MAADKPDKIAGLIYIAAILPEDGKSTVDYTGIPNPETIFPNHDRSEIRHALGSQPIQALSGTFQSKPGFKDKEKYYIACSQDNVIGCGRARKHGAGLWS